jgi:DNA polymerase-3 subunit epsilon
MEAGIAQWNPLTAPFAVVDVETAGLAAGETLMEAHIVEVAVVHLHALDRPRAALNTLVRPTVAVRRSVEHGLSDAHLAEAPAFEDLADHLLGCFAGRVCVAHNVRSDLPVLEGAMMSCGRALGRSPWLCSMRLARRLGFAPAGLQDVATALGISPAPAHVALGDAWTTARVLRVLLRMAAQLGISSFGELADCTVYPDSAPSHAPQTVARKAMLPRVDEAALFDSSERVHACQGLLMPYLHRVAMLGAVEGADVEARVRRLGLNEQEMRAVHGMCFANFLMAYGTDSRVDDAESLQLARVARRLRELGWCPGDEPA